MGIGGNILSANMESCETSVSDWLAGACALSIAQSTTQALNGTHSLQATIGTTAPTNPVVQSNTQPLATPGVTYWAYFWVFAPKAAQMRVDIDWRTSGAVFISETNGPNITLTANVWMRVAATGLVAPPTTNQFSMLLTERSTGTNFASTDLVYFDEMFFGVQFPSARPSSAVNRSAFY